MIYLVADLSGVNFLTQQQDSISSAKKFFESVKITLE